MTESHASAPARLGVTVAPSKYLSVESVGEIAVLAEDLGYESVWIPETWGADAVTVLTLVALKTRRIKIASGVFNVFSRSAAVIAQTAATLQTLSGGRFILGLGTSGPAVVQNWHGSQFRFPVSRTQEYVNILRLALGGQRVDFQGLHIHLAGFRLMNSPRQPIPIYIAALGPKNVYMTGEVADGWLPIFTPRGRLGSLLETLHSGIRAANRQPNSVDVAAYLPVCIGPRGDSLLCQQLAYYLGGMGEYYANFVSNLELSSDVETVKSAWKGKGRKAAVAAASATLLDQCTLGSDSTEAHHRLAEYRSDGVCLPVIAPPHGATLDEVGDTLQALAPTSLPKTTSSRIPA
ncbi:MAG: TIGR04024 family LLM class F420-dependent oxidoreductase [Chloroflexota bacterium]